MHLIDWVILICDVKIQCRGFPEKVGRRWGDLSLLLLVPRAPSSPPQRRTIVQTPFSPKSYLGFLYSFVSEQLWALSRVLCHGLENKNSEFQVIAESRVLRILSFSARGDKHPIQLSTQLCCQYRNSPSWGESILWASCEVLAQSVDFTLVVWKSAHCLLVGSSPTRNISPVDAILRMSVKGWKTRVNRTSESPQPHYRRTGFPLGEYVALSKSFRFWKPRKQTWGPEIEFIIRLLS